MRQGSWLLGCLALSACGGGLGQVGPAEVQVAIVDQGVPRPGLEVLGLDDASEVLGRAVTDAEGVAVVPLARAGMVWLAANAGAGRGFVSRVAVERLGRTDVGVRALTRLDEQPSVFRLKGLGYEERLTAFENGLWAALARGTWGDFAVGQGLLLARADRGPLTGVDLVTGAVGTVAELGQRPDELTALEDPRYLEVVQRAYPNDPGAIAIYDSVGRRVVDQRPVPWGCLQGPPPWSHVSSGVLVQALACGRADADPALWLRRLPLDGGPGAEDVAWTPGPASWTLLPQVRGERVVAAVQLVDGGAELAVLEPSGPGARLSLGAGIDAVGPVSTDGGRALALRSGGLRQEVLELTLGSPRVRVVTAFDLACPGTTRLSWRGSGPAVVTTGCADGGVVQVAAVLADGPGGELAPLPLAGLEDLKVLAVDPLDAEESPGAPRLLVLAADGLLRNLSLWTPADGGWGPVWRSTSAPPTRAPGLMTSPPGSRRFVLVPSPGSFDLQVVPLDQLELPAPAHTWARSARRPFAASRDDTVYYPMNDPLSGLPQVFGFDLPPRVRR